MCHCNISKMVRIFLLALLVGGLSAWAVTAAYTAADNGQTPAACPCNCGCEKSGACDCGKKGVACPCDCGCAKSGVCACGKKNVDGRKTAACGSCCW